MDEKLRILVVGGHPADVFDHCGGTMAHHIKDGDTVTCLALTQGLRIHDAVVSEVFRFGTGDRTPEEIERICREREEVKQNEVRKACALFGITDVRFLSYDDKMLQVTMEMIDAVAKVIRDVRPHIICTHYPQTYGNVTNHHGNAAKITLDAASLAGTVDFDDPNPSWRTPQFAFMLDTSDSMAFNALSGACPAVANYYVDVTDVVDLKVKALEAMESQQYGGDYARKVIETENGVYGLNTRHSYCEAFVMNTPEVGTKLHVSDWLILRANEPEIDSRLRDYRLLT